VVIMTVLVVLGLVVLVLASGVVGWQVAARRHQATESSLHRELESARSGAEQAQARHEAIVSELTRTALRVIRTQGGDLL
jgi:Flp pilus assembly protein TadB